MESGNTHIFETPVSAEAIDSSLEEEDHSFKTTNVLNQQID